MNYVLLDRDGVINQDSDDYIKSAAEWRPIPGSLEAIALLNLHGFKIVVISNQSGLARGYYTLTDLQQMHHKMHTLLAKQGGKIEAVYYCPHAPDDKCECRKPKPGMLKAFSAEKNVSLKNLFFVGDSLSDIQAALAVQSLPLLVKTGKGEKTIRNNPQLTVPIFENLYDAAKFIITTA